MRGPGILFLFAAAAASAATPARESVPDYWLFRGDLPGARRVERRQIIGDEQTAAKTAIENWMSDHQGALSEDDRAGLDGGVNIWVLPARQLPALDAMLATLGRLTAAASSAPAEIDARDLAYKRDGLRAEMKRLSARDTQLPAISLLASAYAASADAILEAKRRSDAEVRVEITLSDPAADPMQFVNGGRISEHGPNVNGAINPNGPNAVTNVNPDSFQSGPHVAADAAGARGADALLPSAYLLAPGAYRIPGGEDAPQDYLLWEAVDAPRIEKFSTVSVVLAAVDAEGALKRLEAGLAKFQADPAPFEAREAVSYTRRFGTVMYPALRPSAYWVRRGDLDAIRDMAKAHGRVLAWNARVHQPGSAFRRPGAVEWEKKLSDDLRAAGDGLAGFPLTRALVLDQLQRLKRTSDLRARYADHELLSVQFVRAP